MRVFVTLLGFNTVDMVRGAVENLETTTTDQEHRFLIKTIFDPGFPGNPPGALEALAREKGWWHTPIANEGVMGNHNRVIHDFYRMGVDDFYVCFDPDVRIQQKGWITAMVEALRSEQEAVFCCASMPFHDEEWCSKQHGRKIHQLPSGLRVAKYGALIAWSMGMWKGEWLAKRPRDFKAANQFYGWTEHADVALMERHKKTWLQVCDYYDHHLGSVGPYATWKLESAQGKTKASYEEWLRTKRK